VPDHEGVAHVILVSSKVPNRCRRQKAAHDFAIALCEDLDSQGAVPSRYFHVAVALKEGDPAFYLVEPNIVWDCPKPKPAKDWRPHD
jgi:hypothetical protein